MTITADELKKAFAPITTIEKSEPAEVDLEKVATTLITEAKDFVSSEDPMANLDGICKRVDEFENMLDDATESEDGTVLVKGSNKLAKDFAPDQVDKAETVVEDKTETDDSGETGETTSDDAGKTETDKTDDSGETTETEKGAEDEWTQDMAPKDIGVKRHARLTKSEQPVPARRGAHGKMEKLQRARERARNGGADRVTV